MNMKIMIKQYTKRLRWKTSIALIVVSIKKLFFINLFIYSQMFKQTLIHSIIYSKCKKEDEKKLKKNQN